MRNPYIGELLGDIECLTLDAQQLAGDLTPRQLSWNPAEGKWSIAQCLDHLVVSGGLYNDKMRPLIDRLKNETAANAPISPYKPTIGGRLLIWVVSPGSRSVSGPRLFRPKLEPQPDVVGEFLKSQETFAALLRAADGLDLSRHKLTSPAAKLLRMNLGDCFTVLVLHTKRHLAQAKRVRETDGFP